MKWSTGGGADSVGGRGVKPIVAAVAGLITVVLIVLWREFQKENSSNYVS